VNLLKILFLLSLSLLSSVSLAANNPTHIPTEYEIKAQFIWNFSEFIEWPKDIKQQKVLCTIGEDPFIFEFDELKKNTKSASIGEIKRNITLHEIDKCNILFVSKTEKYNLSKIFRKTANKPILTISEITGFADKGGIIEFINENGYVKIIVNYRIGNLSKLRISARLLKISLKVLN
jgi:hypothetical protein